MYLFNYLLKRWSDKGGERERQFLSTASFCKWPNSQAGADRSQEPGTPFRSSVWAVGCQALGHHRFPKYINRKLD